MTIEAVREQGKPTAVTWKHRVDYKARINSAGAVVVESQWDGDGWVSPAYPDASFAITAYRILKEGLEPPEGFEVEYEGGRIIRVQRDDGFFVARRRSDNGMWEVPRGTYTAEEVGQLAPILAEIAEQEAES